MDLQANSGRAVVTFDIPPMLPHPSQRDPANTVGTEGDNMQQLKTPTRVMRFLGRPEYKDIPEASIAALDPELLNAPLDYIRDMLLLEGPRMWLVIHSVRNDYVGPGLPTEVGALVGNDCSDPPTHMLAVYDRSPNKGQPSGGLSRGIILPIHYAILAVHCANLPPIKQNRRKSTISDSSTPIKLPVMALGILSPDTFPMLLQYLYTKRTDELLTTLLPYLPQWPGGDPSTRDIKEVKQAEKVDLAWRLASIHTCSVLVDHMWKINGLWRNVWQLGIFVDELWIAMDFAWDIILMAIAISTRNPGALDMDV